MNPSNLINGDHLLWGSLQHPPFPKHTFHSQNFCASLEDKHPPSPNSRRLAGNFTSSSVFIASCQSPVGQGVYRLKEPSTIPQPHLDSRPSLLWPRKVPQSCSPIWRTHGVTLSSSQVLSGGRKGGAAPADQPLGGGNACALGPAGASAGSAPHY